VGVVVVAAFLAEVVAFQVVVVASQVVVVASLVVAAASLAEVDSFDSEVELADPALGSVVGPSGELANLVASSSMDFAGLQAAVVADSFQSLQNKE
jgi:hypothetical protein